MGFRKALYDVAEKGLNPNQPHKELGPDGRLKPPVSPTNNLQISQISNDDEKETETHFLSTSSTTSLEKGNSEKSFESFEEDKRKKLNLKEENLKNPEIDNKQQEQQENINSISFRKKNRKTNNKNS